MATAEDTAGNGVLVATDVDSPTLSYSIVSNGIKGTVTITDATTGAYTYTPNTNANGSDTFTFKANDGALDSNTATITVTITPVNDAPVAMVDSFTANEGGTATALNLAANDSDADGILDLNLNSITIVSPPGNGILVVNPDGTVDYTHDGSETLTDSFTYTIDDQSGVTSNTTTVNLTITPINDAPVAQVGALTTAENTPANGVLVATDVDSPTLSYSIVSNGSKGTATITNATTGAYTYTPNLNANGTDTFSFKANDGSSDSNIASITVTINASPVAQANTLITDEDTPANGVLVATDVDSSTLSYSIVSNGNKGTASITNATTGAYTYTPNLDANGSDTFSFKANDASSDSNIATITVTINPINDAPVALNGALTTAEDTAGNDVLVATDVDSPTLTYSIVSNGSSGTATITDATTGTYTYTPNLNANGTDTFSFKANDSDLLDSNIATVTVTITPVNDPPVATVGCGTTPQAVTFNGTLIAIDPDTTDTLTYSLNADGSGGMGPITTAKGGTVTLLDAATGTYTYAPATGAGDHRGRDSFDYQVTDFAGAFNSATETVIVDQKIMPLGDSITTGEEWIGPGALDYLTNLNPAGDVIGYRKSLFDNLNTAGYSFDFVGSLNNGSTFFSDTDHEGHDGWTAAEIAFGGDGSPGHDPAGNVQAWLNSNPADIILLHAGTNNLLGTTATDIANILDEIDIWESTNNPITVLLALIIDQNPIEPYVTTFNNNVQTMVAGRTGDNIIIVDEQSALTYPTDLSEDISVVGISKALHPTAGGYTKMAAPWYAALNTVLDKCP